MCYNHPTNNNFILQFGNIITVFCEALSRTLIVCYIVNIVLILMESALNSLSNGCHIIIWVILIVKTLKMGGDANSHVMTPFLMVLIAGFWSPTP